MSKKIITDDFSDKELFFLLQQSNKEAFTIIYQKYNKLLYALSYRYLMDKSLAEDAVQHVFVKLWEFHKHLDIALNLKNYLYTITKNYILNQIRDNNNAIRHNYMMFQSGNLQDYEESLHVAIEEKETLKLFYDAINKLPEQKKAICLMKLSGKLSNQDIADKMNLSINTVKTHYAQSLKILKQYLKTDILLVLTILLL